MSDLSVISVSTTIVPSSTSFVADLGANQENDLIVIGATFRSAGTITCGSGYTSAAAQQTTDSMVSEWFVKKVGASPESAPTISTTGAAATGAFIAYVIRGADVSGTALQAIDAIGSTAGSVGGTLTSHALTTVATNTLVIHGAVWDATSVLATPAAINMLGSTLAFASGVTFAAASGAIPTFTFLGSNTANTGRAWALSIKNGGGGLPTRLIDGRAYVQTLGGFGTTPTNSAPNVYSTTTINGITTHNVASTLGAGQAVNLPWAVSGASLACPAAVIGADRWVGSYLSCPSVNLAGKIVSFPYGFSTTTDNTRVGAEGLIIVLASSAGNWIAYQVRKQAKWTTSWSQTLVIKPGTTAAYASEGTVDLTAIVAIGYLHHRTASASVAITTFHGSPILESAVSKVVGGGPDGNNSVATAAMLLLGGGNTYSAGVGIYPGAVDFKGSGQLVNKFGLQLGDGSTATHIIYTAQSYDIPAVTDDTWRVGTSGAGLAVKASASDTIDLRSAIITSSILQPLTIDAASSLSASLLTTGLSVIGRSFSDLAGYAWTSVSWTDCATVAFKDSDVTTCTITSPNAAISGTTGAACSFSASGAVVTNSTISCVKKSGSVTGYHLELGALNTAITLADVTFNGTPGTDKLHVLATTGTVTITISGTTSLAAADVTSAGATVVISAPLLYQSVTISNITTTSRVQIYDTSATPPVGSRELYNGVPGATSITWTDSLAAVASRSIRVRIADVTGTTAKNFIEANIGTCGVTSGTQSVSYLANQTNDTTYNTNAVNGSLVTGITFTDAATDLVNVNLAGGNTTWPNIYAAFAYWISTSAGIDDDVAYVDAVDPANYLLTSMKIKNTSSPSVPLTITGGFGRDATSGTIADIIDTTGGNIYPLVDHVVVANVGSGPLTATQDAKLMGLPSATTTASATLAAAATTPIAANIKQVNSLAVDGAGTEADPWGPQ